MILFLDEMANVPPIESTVETWEDWMDDLAEQLSEACRRVDPQTTDEMLSKSNDPTDALVAAGRRGGK